MGEGFKKLKRKYLQGVLIKSALLGVSCALIAAGASLLACKLASISLHAGYCVLIAIGAALIGGGITFLVLKPDDKKLAVRLDTEYNLNEKVQTAVAFAGESGAIVEMQREDADARLKNLPKAKFEFAKIWQYFVIAVISLVFIFTGAFVPAKSEENAPANPPIVDPPFALAEEHKIKLNQVIENVGKSELDGDTKTAVTAEIYSLIDDLEEVGLESEMKTVVEAALASVKFEIIKTTSYKQIATALNASGESELAQIIVSAIGIYRRFPIVDFADVDRLKFSQGVDDATDGQFTALFERLGEDLGNTPLTVKGALIASAISQEDGLYVALNAFAEEVSDYGEQDRLTFRYNLCDELAGQVYKLGMNKYVTNRVRTVFGLEIPADDAFTLNGGGSSDDDQQQDNGGGYGSGNVLYGSDDEVYDPDSGEYVPYGELLNKYYAIVQELMRSGEMTEEQANVVREYFEILFSGFPA